jgi:hypothetical protein
MKSSILIVLGLLIVCAATVVYDARAATNASRDPPIVLFGSAQAKTR